MPNDDDKTAAAGGGRGAGLDGGLALVPESVLKRRHDLDDMKARRAAQRISNPRGNRKVFSSKTGHVVRVRRPETYLARSVSRWNHGVRYDRVGRKGMQKRASDERVVRTKRVAKVADDDDDDDDDEAAAAGGEAETTEVRYAANSVGASVVFAIRLRDGVGISPKVRKALSRMRLRNVNEGVFLRYNKATRKMLHLVEPWVSYGIVTKSTVSDLIKRRGHGRVDGKRVPLSDNTVIEGSLGDSGIVCVEDVVHEIHGAGDGFSTAASFLWPFRLASHRSKFQREKLGRKGGGDYGDCGEGMDGIVRGVL